MEIERKYLVTAPPADYRSWPYRQIEQAYLCTDPTVRIRREDDDYYLTYKSKGLLVREEYNLPLTREAYAHLLGKADGIVLTKKRYLKPLSPSGARPDAAEHKRTAAGAAERGQQQSSVSEHERTVPVAVGLSQQQPGMPERERTVPVAADFGQQQPSVPERERAAAGAAGLSQQQPSVPECERMTASAAGLGQQQSSVSERERAESPLMIEMDVFEGAYAGLILAEVEFPTEDAALAFTPPEWFGRDVTFTGEYSNSRLATAPRPPENKPA